MTENKKIIYKIFSFKFFTFCSTEIFKYSKVNFPKVSDIYLKNVGEDKIFVFSRYLPFILCFS